jgi:25S rRNA (cytosine2870-C5)-methyltransferase
MGTRPSGDRSRERNNGAQSCECARENRLGSGDTKVGQLILERLYNEVHIGLIVILRSNLKSRQQNISRGEIMSSLTKDLSEYYGYIPELSELLMDLLSPAECVEYMDASDRPRPTVIRTNTLKISRKDLMEALVKRGVAVEEVEWSKVAIKVTESSVPIGATPEYLSGYYMLQSAASMNPVMALDPQPGER